MCVCVYSFALACWLCFVLQFSHKFPVFFCSGGNKISQPYWTYTLKRTRRDVLYCAELQMYLLPRFHWPQPGQSTVTAFINTSSCIALCHRRHIWLAVAAQWRTTQRPWLCSCMSDCMQLCQGQGSILCLRMVWRAHTSQTNWTLGGQTCLESDTVGLLWVCRNTMWRQQ